MSKRFKSILNDIGLVDNASGKKYVYFNKDVVKLMNDLSRENDKLKAAQSLCNELSDENKKLKKENKDLKRFKSRVTKPIQKLNDMI